MILAIGHVDLSVNILKDFSSENTRPISIKFRMQPLGKGGKKMYIFCPGHITKVATLPIYGKTIQNSSSPEPPGGLS